MSWQEVAASAPAGRGQQPREGFAQGRGALGTTRPCVISGAPQLTTGEAAGSCAEAPSNLMPPARLGHRALPRAGAERSPIPRLPPLRCRRAGSRVGALRSSSACWKALGDGCLAEGGSRSGGAPSRRGRE